MEYTLQYLIPFICLLSFSSLLFPSSSMSSSSSRSYLPHPIEHACTIATTRSG
ncbi:hypothetical protein BDV59DRAFT_183084 [Aspergillus ambiguus]|uniref:uncharacterized protein n=1 Tax=Aspergillus ambiguus TaxID=176160 RepID=UPI003CCD5AA8